MKTTTYFFCLLFSVIMFINSAVAQTYNGNLLLTTQAQIDNFNYTAVTGNLTINGNYSADITNLNGLSELTYIGGGLGIFNTTALPNIDGLTNITQLNYLTIRENSALTNMDGLSSLIFCPTISLWYNVLLSNVNSLSNLSGTIDLLFIFSPSLTSLDPLSGITSVTGAVWLTSCYALSNVDGLSNIESVGSLRISEALSITNLDGLSKLNTVADILLINNNHLLKNTDGLSNLTYVGGNVQIYRNLTLMNLNGLANLSSVGGEILIGNNSELTEFCGLFTLFNTSTFTGVYECFGNAYNPTIEDIIAGGPCEYNIEEGFEDLVITITELPVNSGTINSLNVKINQAILKYNEGKLNVALNLLNAFIEQVNELVMNDVLTQLEGDALISNANALKDAISLLMLKHNTGEYNANEVNYYMLEQNYPNPFNPNTSISYQLADQGYVSLVVYDLLGREVITLVNEVKPSGYYQVDFNAADLPSGVYIYRIQAGSFTETKKMTLIK